MQLKKIQPIKSKLSVATCTLLGTVNSTANAIGTDSPWEFDSALMYYSETDRVSAIEPVFSARKELKEDEFVKMRLVWDVLTGASPNGAVPTSTPQTFTRPSGRGQYRAKANETPLDDTFHDSRVAINAEWEKPINRLTSGIYGINFSKEYDYISLGLSATFSKDFNQRNTTVTAAASIGQDKVSPVGGFPEELAPMGRKATGNNAEENKDVADVLFGVTQVLSRKSLLQFNYAYGTSDGYNSDPYKILSVVRDEDDSNPGELVDDTPYVYESRPDERKKNAVYAKWVYHFEEDVLNASYRYFFDDWGIRSHTVDLRYRYELGRGHFLQPHIRYYQQSEADFYEPFLTEQQLDSGNIEHASADYRLADMITTTVGLMYGMEISPSSDLIVRAEYMKQSGDQPDEAFGALQEQDLFPDVDAVILHVGFNFTF